MRQLRAVLLKLLLLFLDGIDEYRHETNIVQPFHLFGVFGSRDQLGHHRFDFLGDETDQCSGNLYVENANGNFVFIPRDGQFHRVNVRLDNDNFWHWECDATLERARG